MALSQLIKDIRRYHQLTNELKPLEKEREALKDKFRALAKEAGDGDAIFQDEKKGLEVAVVREESSRLDTKAIRAAHGEEYDITTTSFKVLARKIAEISREKECA
jgi:hypothetical protein